jgi:MinD superfamily P-loop ATPase
LKQLLILSGKGGTGKTTVASAFIRLSKAKAYADCDVDAPNLHLVAGGQSSFKASDYYGLPVAYIDTNICTSCNLCKENCRFDAISSTDVYRVDSYSCEGCGVCEYLCPAHAISLLPNISGELMLYSDKTSIFSTARLKMGSGTSGKLVTEVKNQMKGASLEGTDLAIIDGSPGIGCPVIASLSGVTMVLIVAEPSLSGFSDMCRIIKTAKIFGVKIAVCINKYDSNIDNSERIAIYCSENNIPLTGKIPFDIQAIKATNNGQTVVDIECAAGYAISNIFRQVLDLI